ncbi:5424_t:CDS:2, partial [Paraglomus occultum]
MQLIAEDECAFYLNEVPRAKAVDFHDFIKEINLPTNEKYYLLLDNAKIHRAIKVLLKKGRLPIKELLAQMNIDPLYLVAYCPQLNPVELIFNFLRSYVEEHEPRTFEELKHIIEK